jgi:hypothetical protein
MHKIGISDPKVAIRCRRAQFLGRVAKMTLKGSTVTGVVRIVRHKILARSNNKPTAIAYL